MSDRREYYKAYFKRRYSTRAGRKRWIQSVKKWQSKRVSDGICRECPSIIFSKTVCKKHLEAKSISMKKLRAKRKQSGLCIDCGESAKKGLVRCQKHTITRNMASRRYRERLRPKTNLLIG